VNLDCRVWDETAHMRNVRPGLLLVENIRTLLYQRRVKAKDLARFCGHEPAWLTKILKGERGVSVDDLPCIAEFFGLQTHELFQHGIGTERRRQQRRQPGDRRVLTDRRRDTTTKGKPDDEPHPLHWSPDDHGPFRIGHPRRSR
jgi:transcriptional regulator with XRE-family HTH domain